MVAKVKKEVSEKKHLSSQINAKKAQEARRQNIDKQKQLRELYGVSSSEEETESDTDEEQEAVIVRSIKKLKPKKNEELNEEVASPLNDFETLKKDIEEIKNALPKRRKGTPRKKKVVVVEKETVQALKPPAPEPETPRVSIEELKIGSIMKRSSSINSLNKESAEEKIQRLINRFKK